jgi:5-methylcytosine-specific restriction enzyme subunit McrC
MNLSVNDCSPFAEALSPEQVEWLRGLASRFETRPRVLALGDWRDDDEPVVYCERDGTWWAGRYVGVIRHEGSSLTIRPRFGLPTLASWLGQAVDAVVVPSPGRLREDEDVPFIVQLLAWVWGRTLADAARHGLPALRRDSRHVGSVVRGRLDVRRTVAERLAGRDVVVSVRRERSLDNPAARVLAAAYRVLRRRMGPGTEGAWIPERVKEVLPALLAAVGTNPARPTDAELSRVRYTPITLGYQRAVHLSQLILRQRGLLSEAETDGESDGVLFDVAELWELFVLAAMRRAAVGLEVRHGTLHADGRDALLFSNLDTLGQLRPDAVIYQHRRVLAILDAKYKSLWPTPWNKKGPQREDLYQLAAYLSRFEGACGVLAYPVNPNKSGRPWGEERNPWYLQSGQRVWMLSLPLEIEGAAEKLQSYLLSTTDRGSA